MRETKKESEVNFLTNTQVASKVVRRWVTSPNMMKLKCLKFYLAHLAVPSNGSFDRFHS